MKIVHMADDYRNMLEKMNRLGKYEAYKGYTEIYKPLFDAVFQYLYCSPMEAFRGYIEGVDFEKLMQVAEDNYDRGICEYIIRVAENTASRLKIEFEFELYLGMELSNIGGCSVPRQDNVPYLYIGIDRSLTKDFIDIFVPHEMYHMIHTQMAPLAGAETLMSRAAEEGLASYTPMWLYGMEWGVETVSNLLGVSVQQAAYLLEHGEQIVEEMMERGDEPLTAQAMQEYFCLTDEHALAALPGYYTGLYLTHLAVRNGIAFESFLSMTSAEVADFWQKNRKSWK